MTMSTYQIPLGTGAQSFSAKLGGQTYKFTLVYREAEGGGWFLDMEGGEGQAILGAPLVTNVNLLGQFAYKRMGAALWCELANRPRKLPYEPAYEDMGRNLTLYWSET